MSELKKFTRSSRSWSSRSWNRGRRGCLYNWGRLWCLYNWGRGRSRLNRGGWWGYWGLREAETVGRVSGGQKVKGRKETLFKLTSSLGLSILLGCEWIQQRYKMWDEIDPLIELTQQSQYGNPPAASASAAAFFSASVWITRNIIGCLNLVWHAMSTQ